MYKPFTPVHRAFIIMAALAAAVGITLLVCFNLILAKNPGNIAIIGGADGPTSIFVSGSSARTNGVQARILEIDAQNMTLSVAGTQRNSVLGDNCIVRCKDALFIKMVNDSPHVASILDLRVGGEVTLSVGAVAESYPTQTTAYLVQFNLDNTDSSVGIPQEVASALSAFPKAYPPKQGEEDGLFVVLHGIVQGDTHAIMKDFLSRSLAQQPAQLILVQYTVEGDPIFTSLTFDGATHQAVVDNTRDAFAGNGAGLTAYSAKNLFVFDSDGRTDVYLCESAELTPQQAQNDGHCLHIVSYASNVQE